MLSSFSTSEPVDIFIASPSPVVFTVYEVGKAYEVCTYLQLTRSSQSIKIGSNRVIFINCKWKSVKTDKKLERLMRYIYVLICNYNPRMVNQ